MDSAVLFFLLAVFVAVAQGSAEDDLSELKLRKRMLEANINLLDPNGKPRFTCLLSQDDKIGARFKNLQIDPEYSWLQNDPRVSISLDRCTATLPASNATGGEKLSVDIISNGRITAAGKGIRLSLQKKIRSTDNAHIYSGKYVPFTLGQSYRENEADVHVSKRIGVALVCEVTYCILGAAVKDGGCLVAVGGSVPQE